VGLFKVVKQRLMLGLCARLVSAGRPAGRLDPDALAQ